MLDSLAVVTVNRTQALVLGFFLVVWVSLLVILVAAPEVFDQALRLPSGHRVVELAVLAGLSGFIGLLAVGVVRRWRWTFWLILIAFLFGVLRVPAAVLQFTGILATNTPGWYVAFQALLGAGPVRHRAGHGGRLPPCRRMGGVLSGATAPASWPMMPLVRPVWDHFPGYLT